MVSMLVLFPPLRTVIPEYELIPKSLNSHSISMGKSPLDIKQVTETESSTLVGSSPKVKGVIFGGTKGIGV